MYSSQIEPGAYTYKNVNISVTLNSDGTAEFVATGSGLNEIVAGNWYNLEQGFLILLNSESVLGNFFTIGADSVTDDLTLEMLQECALTDISMTEEECWYIAWGEDILEYIEGLGTWIEE